MGLALSDWAAWPDRRARSWGGRFPRIWASLVGVPEDLPDTPRNPPSGTLGFNYRGDPFFWVVIFVSGAGWGGTLSLGSADSEAP